MYLSNGSLVTTKTPISLTTSSWFPSMPPMSSHGWPSAYAGIYSRQLWVYVLVNKLAKAEARLPLPVYERDAMNRPRADDHPMAKLLREPNPGLSGFHLWLWTRSMRGIHGEAFWYKKRARGQVVGLYPFSPTAMHYREDEGLWFFDNGRMRLDGIPDADLVHFRDFNPDSNSCGLSPLEPLRATLENEWHARTATSSFWQRGARPGTALSHPGKLSQEAQDRLKAQYDAIAAGSGNTGTTVVLEEGMEPKPLTLTAEEAQYIETRKLNREEVCAAYDVPPPVVHILDRATFSNITEQMRSMYRDTMAPLLKDDEATVEVDLRAAEWPNDNVYAEFLMDEVLRGDFEARSDAYAKADYMTLAEKRKAENLPFIEGTDRIFMNTATMPLDAIDAQAQAIAAQTAASEEPLADVIPLSVARSVMGRLSWQTSLDEVDPKALTADVADTAPILAALADEKASGGSVASLKARLRGMASKEAVAGRRIKAPDLGGHQAKVRSVLEGFFDRQGASVLSSGSFDTEAWNKDLAGDLHATAVAVSSAIGKSTMRTLGFNADDYDVARTVDFLQAVAVRLAVGINATTKDQLDAADADPEHVFAVAKESRADGIAVGVTTLAAGFAVTESGKRAAEASGTEATKTWITGENPRAAHAALNGETVGIDETFSNGAQWPGDDGEPGCNCSVEVSA